MFLAERLDLRAETPSELVSSDSGTFNFTLRNEPEVFKAIKELNKTKGTGCDGIPVRV